MIPKRIIQGWIGEGRPEGARYDVCDTSAILTHATWEYKFITDADVEPLLAEAEAKTALPLRAFYERQAAYTGRHPVNAIRMDLLRVCALYCWGGFWLDLDVYCVRPLDPFLADDLVLAEITEGGLVSEAVIGAPSGSPQLLDVLTQYVTTQEPDSGVCSLFLGKWAAANNVKPYPPQVFIPHRRTAPAHCSYEFPEAYTVHLWGSREYDLEVIQWRAAEVRREIARREKRNRQ